MKWKDRVKRLEAEVYVLYLALKDRRTPWYAKALLAAVVAYALSPLDLIPDFIPVLGYLDDLIIVPAGIYLAMKLIPAELREEYQRQAGKEPVNTRARWVAAIVVVLIWLLVVYLIVKAVWL